jgi:hypothetical protein
VKLSCEPSTGYITEDGYFVCLGSGVLTATYDQASLPIQIVMVDEGNPALRLDKVLISDKTPYAIEINGTIDNKPFGILPSAVEWTIDDNSICSIDKDGVLHALKNGTTAVHGTLGDTHMTLEVQVEMVNADKLLWEDMIDLEQRWAMKASSSAWNTDFTTDAEGKANLYMNYTGGRVAQLSLTADTLLYSTPKHLETKFTPQGELITRIDFGFEANNGLEASYACVEFTPEQEKSICIDIDSLFGVKNDMAIYPVTLKYMSFTLNTKAEKREYNIPFEGIYLHYSEQIASGIECITTPEASENQAYKLLEDGQLIIIKNNKTYNTLGHEITKKY